MTKFLKRNFLLSFFFLIIILSTLDNQIILIDNILFNNLGINRINIKWVSFLFTIFLACYLLADEKKYFSYIYDQKYFIIFILYIFTYSLINFFIFYEPILNNFEKIKFIFKLNAKLSIYIYFFSKIIYWLSLLAIFFLFFIIIEKYNKYQIEKYFLIFFLIFLFLNIFYQYSLLNDLNYIIKYLGSYSRDFVAENFVGKKVLFENEKIIFSNVLHERYTGTFREPSYLAFYSSIIFFVSFSKKINNTLVILMRLVAAHLIFATVSMKILPLFLLLILYLSIIVKSKKVIFWNYLSPIFLAFIINLVFFDHVFNLITKSLYYINAFFPDIFTLIASLLYKSNISVLVGNVDAVDKLATGIVMKSENFEHVDFIKIIFGFSYITDKLENFYLLFLGKSAVIHTFFVSGIFVFLILYQFYKNILIINKKEISQNLILLIYIFQYVYFTKDTFQIDLILIYIIAYLNSKNEFKYFK